MDESNYLAYHYYLAFDWVQVDLEVHSMLHLGVQGDLGRLSGVQGGLGRLLGVQGDLGVG